MPDIAGCLAIVSCALVLRAADDIVHDVACVLRGRGQ